MKTKKILILGVLFIFILNMNMKAQQEIQLSSIINKKWVSRFENKEYYLTLKFSTTEQISTFITGDKRTENVVQYYLSNTVDTIFNPKKVGKNKSGSYLIEKKIKPVVTQVKKQSPGVHIHKSKQQTEDVDFIVYEIVQMDKNHLLLKSLVNNNVLKYILE